MQMAGRATWKGMPFPCKWMKRGRQLPIRVDRNMVSCRAQEGNLRGEDLEKGPTQKRSPGDITVLGAPSKRRRLPTLPHCIAVPSAQVGLTSLFGMGRGGTPPQ